jgi:response regulator RpfG family c-di-GMP phosphodiesterase
VTRRILCVDDEASVLRGLERSLFDTFEIETALSGEEALKHLAQGEPFAVVMSDMRMPGMDGATLLSRIRQLYPNTVRVLLTGYAEVNAAIAAVNEGQIFRFLVKPSSQETLTQVLGAAIHQYELVIAEKELVERTLMGAVHMLTEVLGLIAPELFSRAHRLKGHVAKIAAHCQLEPRWAYELSAMLSQLGCIALPKEIIDRVASATGVSDKDRTLFESHPEIAYRLLREIPRLELVADIVRYQLDRDLPASEREEVRNGVMLLRMAIAIDALVMRGSSLSEAVAAVRRRNICDAKWLDALLESRGSDPKGMSARTVTLDALAVGMLLEADVRTSSGAVVVAQGKEVTPLILERLKKFSQGVGLMQPIHVRIPD